MLLVSFLFLGAPILHSALNYLIICFHNQAEYKTGLKVSQVSHLQVQPFTDMTFTLKQVVAS